MSGLRQADGWNATRPTPWLSWDGRTDLKCLARVVGRRLASGYAHHIERLIDEVS